MWERILRLERIVAELLTRVSILEARLAAIEQQGVGRWY